MSNPLRRWIRIVGGSLAGDSARNLSTEEAAEAFGLLLEGEGTEAQVGSFCTAMRAKGASADELAGFAKASRERISFPSLSPEAVVVSTSRLGKSHSPPLGLAAAAVASAAGASVLLQVAPHAEGAGVTIGDLVVRMGGAFAEDPKEIEVQMERTGLSCWQSVGSGEGWQRLWRIEEEVGLRSIPDTVCKLTAPDGARLVVPAMSGPVLGKAGDAVAALGHQRALVMQGMEGSVDPYLCETTRGLFLAEGIKSPLRLEPMDLGLFGDSEPAQMHEDRLEAAVLATQKAITGVDGPEFQVSLLGAAILLRLADLSRDFASAVAQARDTVESGKAGQRLNDMLGV